jgi:hypothetical protein
MIRYVLQPRRPKGLVRRYRLIGLAPKSPSWAQLWPIFPAGDTAFDWSKVRLPGSQFHAAIIGYRDAGTTSSFRRRVRPSNNTDQSSAPLALDSGSSAFVSTWSNKLPHNLDGLVYDGREAYLI